MNPTWCDPYCIIKQQIVCGNWRCTCGALVRQHCSGNCGCGECPTKDSTFTYGSNDDCTIECQFQRKIFEIENKA